MSCDPMAVASHWLLAAHQVWNKNMYQVSAVKAITHARSMNETVAGYCKRKSKVDKNLPNAYDNDSKESV